MSKNKRIGGLIILLVLIAISLPAYSEEPGVEKSKKERIIVFPFTESGAAGTGIGRLIADAVITKLHGLGRFEMVDRVNIEKIMDEQRLLLSGLMETDNAIKIGNLAGAKLAIVGNVTGFSVGKNSKGGFDGSANVDLKVINVETSQIEKAINTGASAAVEYSEKHSDQVQRETARQQLVNKITDNAYSSMRELFKLKSYIMTVDGRKVTMRLGEDMGIRTNWRFDAVKKGSSIKDPFTGEILKSNDLEIANIWITKVDKNISYGKVYTSRGVLTPGTQLVEYPASNVFFKLTGGVYPFYQVGLSSSAVYNDEHDDYKINFVLNPADFAAVIGFEGGRKAGWGVMSFDFDLIIRMPLFSYRFVMGGLADILRLGPFQLSAGAKAGLISSSAYVGEVTGVALEAPSGEQVPLGTSIEIDSFNLGVEGIINLDWIINKKMSFSVVAGISRYMSDPWSISASWTPEGSDTSQKPSRLK